MSPGKLLKDIEELKDQCNGANVCCFLSSLPLLPPASTAVFGSYTDKKETKFSSYIRKSRREWLQ
jgi:hypothetical protein